MMADDNQRFVSSLSSACRMSNTASNNYSCKSVEIAAYLDGELDGSACALFDEHVKACRACAVELLEQRRLLCALDLALDDDPALALPKNFAQVVTAHAESDMRGVRGRTEHSRALRLCALLALGSFALLGGAAINQSVLSPLRIVARHVLSVISFIVHAGYDAGEGVVVILRAIGGHMVYGSHPLGLLALLFLAAALALLPALIRNYHRT